jgi:hypothetical protein
MSSHCPFHPPTCSRINLDTIVPSSCYTNWLEKKKFEFSSPVFVVFVSFAELVLNVVIELLS